MSCAIAITLSILAVACSGSRPTLGPDNDANLFDADLSETVNDIADRPLTDTAGNLIDGPALTEPGAPIEAAQRAVVNQRLDHDLESFTQGLVFDNGRLFESRGRYGESALTEIHPENGTVLRRVSLPDTYFGEGLAVVDDRLIMLTWKAETAFVFDLASFQEIDRLSYEGEGWGLCYDGADLWMSDGSDVLSRRDPDSFALLDQVFVTLNGRRVTQLNELECIGDLVWANVWQTNTIVIIDPATGEVVSSIEARGLLTDGEADLADVLNGIAYDDRREVIVLTGKLWPAMFEVDLVPCDETC